MQTFLQKPFFFFAVVSVTVKWIFRFKGAIVYSLYVWYNCYVLCLLFPIALTRSLAVRRTIERCWGHADPFSSGYSNVQIYWSQGFWPLHTPHLWHVIFGGLKWSCYVTGLLLWLQSECTCNEPLPADHISWEWDCSECFSLTANFNYGRHHVEAIFYCVEIRFTLKSIELNSFAFAKYSVTFRKLKSFNQSSPQ